VDINSNGAGEIISKLQDVFPLMKEVDCPYQTARWPMECQVRNVISLFINYYKFSFLNINCNVQTIKEVHNTFFLHYNLFVFIVP